MRKRVPKKTPVVNVWVLWGIWAGDDVKTMLGIYASKDLATEDRRRLQGITCRITKIKLVTL